MAHFASPQLPSHSGLCYYCSKLNFEKLRLPLASEAKIFRFPFESQGFRSDSSFLQRLDRSESDEELINSQPLNERQELEEEDVEAERPDAEPIYDQSVEEMLWANKDIESDESDDALIESQSTNYKHGLGEDNRAGNLDENSITNESPEDIQRAEATETEEVFDQLINQSFQEVQITDEDTEAQEMKYVEEGTYGTYMGKITRVEESSESCWLCKVAWTNLQDHKDEINWGKDDFLIARICQHQRIQDPEDTSMFSNESEKLTYSMSLVVQITSLEQIYHIEYCEHIQKSFYDDEPWAREICKFQTCDVGTVSDQGNSCRFHPAGDTVGGGRRRPLLLDVGWIREWIGICEREHGAKCQLHENEAPIM
jgi:hypothetical protein